MPTSFATFLDPAGIIVSAGICTAIVELIKGVFPLLDQRVSGALMAFCITGALYVFTALALPPVNPDGALTIFLAWLACATSSVGIHGAAAHVQRVTK